MRQIPIVFHHNVWRANMTSPTTIQAVTLSLAVNTASFLSTSWFCLRVQNILKRSSVHVAITPSFQTLSQLIAVTVVACTHVPESHRSLCREGVTINQRGVRGSRASPWTRNRCSCRTDAGREGEFGNVRKAQSLLLTARIFLSRSVCK